MNCTNCEGQLSATTTDDPEVYRCDNCGGLFLKKDILVSHIFGSKRDISFITVSPGELVSQKF